MTTQELDRIFDTFNSLNALIIGDVMIDSYLWGKVNRISPEAPVPIVTISKKEHRLGGAANVALNIHALGATPILCSVIGSDMQGDEIINLLKENGLPSDGIIQNQSRTTTVKTRVIGSKQQMLRVDEENDTEITPELEGILFSRIQSVVENNKIDVIVFEDYDKGVITSGLINKTIEFARKKNIPTIADPKNRNFLAYRDISVFKPNLKELKEGLKIEVNPTDLNSLINGVNKLQELLNFEKALITLSEHGLLIGNNSKVQLIPAHIRNIADVSGAGDTVISVAALCLAQKLDDHTMGSISNLAGGLVCEKVGVVTIEKSLLRKESQTLIS